MSLVIPTRPRSVRRFARGDSVDRDRAWHLVRRGGTLYATRRNDGVVDAWIEHRGDHVMLRPSIARILINSGKLARLAWDGSYGRWVYNPGNANNATLSETDVREIRRMLRLGMSQRAAAERFSVTKQTISALHCGLTWSHVRG